MKEGQRRMTRTDRRTMILNNWPFPPCWAEIHRLWVRWMSYNSERPRQIPAKSRNLRLQQALDQAGRDWKSRWWCAKQNSHQLITSQDPYNKEKGHLFPSCRSIIGTRKHVMMERGKKQQGEEKEEEEEKRGRGQLSILCDSEQMLGPCLRCGGHCCLSLP